MKLLSITTKEFNLFINMLKGEDPKEALKLQGISQVDKLTIYNQLIKTSK